MAGERDGNGGDSVAEKLVGFIREDIARMETRFSEQLARLVTQDAFARERERVDGKFADLGADLVREREERIAAVTEIEQAAKAATAKAEQAQNERVRTRAAWKQGIVIGLIVTLGGGVVALLVALVQSAAHLS